MEFNKEQIEKAKNCKTIEEFKSLAKAEGLNFSDTDAEKYFNATRIGELNDDDLDKVAGGKGEPDPKFKKGQVIFLECKYFKILNASDFDGKEWYYDCDVISGGILGERRIRLSEGTLDKGVVA